MIWNERAVERWLREAAQTICGLRVGPVGPRSLKAWWPEIIQSHEEAYGYHKPKVLPASPSPAAIDRLGQVESWVNKWLSEDERHVVWTRVNGLPWRKVARECQRWGIEISHVTAKKIYRKAIWTLVCRLNGRKK